MKINNSGNSLIEVIIALAIFSLLSSSLVSLILGNLSILSNSGNATKGEFLAQEGIEAMRSIKNRAWNELNINSSAIQINNNEWNLAGEGTSEQIDNFSRTVYLRDVFRDSNNNIIASTSPLASSDRSTKEVRSKASWISSRNNNISVELITYLSNWNSLDYEQTNWSGGDGQQIYLLSDKFFAQDSNIDISQNGQISLSEVASSTFANSGYIKSSEFFMGDRSHANMIIWSGTIASSCVDCKIELRIKTAEDISGIANNWSATGSGPDGEDGDETDYYSASSTPEMVNQDHNDDQWIKYKATLTSNGDYSPILKSISINYKK